jgi:dynamin 1-like protein
MSIKAGGPASEKEKFEIELIHNLLSSYFNIVRKNVQDAVPKAIMHFLVNASKENIQNELVRSLYREDLLAELLEESPEIAQRRKHCRAMLDVLKRASDILNEVRDYNPTRM